MRVAVIGAGPAGLSAAYELVKQGVVVDVYEAGRCPGGMAKSIQLWGQRVDLGPHRFFSNNKKVNELWLEVVGRDYKIVNRLTRILYNKKFYAYPLSPFNAFKNIGPLESCLCMLYFAKEKIFPTKQNGSFESWVTHRFGKRLFEIFFRDYTEKLWGLPCSQIDCDFASQRIKKLSLYEAVINAFFKNNSKHRTLVDQFAYPCHGTGIVYERMANFVQTQGSKVFYQTPVEKIVVKNQKAHALLLTDGSLCEGYDHIISTMPLSLMVSRLDDVPATVKDAACSLRFRNTILIYLQINATNLFPDQWIYIQSSEFKAGRITNFRNWVPELYGEEKSTILVMEYWCNDEDPIWKESSETLVNLASGELSRMGFGPIQVLNGHIERVPKCYPVYNKGYREKVTVIQGYLNTIQALSVIGRYGAFKYNNQDHSILMGILAAANLTQGQHHDLWGINTDYDEYQESFVITKTGLVKQ